MGFAAIMLAALLTNKYIFGVVMLASLVIMMREFLHMTCGKNYWFSQILSILAGATLFTLTYLFRGFGFPGKIVILAFIPVFILMINSLYVKDKSRFDKFSNLYAALVYIAVPWTVLNFAAFNVEGEFSGVMLLCFFAIIWGTDVGAYLFGITLGQKYGKKLFPSISPKKSWIGFWGGMLTAIGVSVALYYAGLFPLQAGQPGHGIRQGTEGPPAGTGAGAHIQRSFNGFGKTGQGITQGGADGAVGGGHPHHGIGQCFHILCQQPAALAAFFPVPAGNFPGGRHQGGLPVRCASFFNFRFQCGRKFHSNPSGQLFGQIPDDPVDQQFAHLGQFT